MGVCALRTTKGCTRVQARREQGKSKMGVVWPKTGSTSRRANATSQRSKKENIQLRDVEIQHRNVLESDENQRRDVKIQCRDVPEKYKNDVATLGSNVATFQRRSNSTSRCWDPTSRRSRDRSN